LDFAQWVQLLKQYGPVVGLLLAFVFWQTRQINRLLEKNSAMYEAEIARMAKVQEQLLERLLGAVQPSSGVSPSVEKLKENARQASTSK
jgi:hypothetical protein